MNWFSSSSHDKHQARGQSWFCTMQMETNPTSLFGNARVLYSVKKPLGKHYQQKRRLLCSAPGYLYKLFFCCWCSGSGNYIYFSFFESESITLRTWLPHGTSYCQTCHKDCVFIKNAAISSVKCTRFPRNNGDTTRHYFVFIFFSFESKVFSQKNTQKLYLEFDFFHYKIVTLTCVSWNINWKIDNFLRLLSLFETFVIFWDFCDYLRLLWKFEIFVTFWDFSDFLRFLWLFETFVTFWDFCDFLFLLWLLETFVTFWDFCDILRFLWLFEIFVTFWDFLRLLWLFETFVTLFSFYDF